jgi:tryptophan synthase beta chain
MSKNKNIIINLSGRGDKDIHTVAEIEGIEF